MHSFEGPFGAEFHYNSDLSGTITIHPVDPSTPSIHITWDDIRAFYLEMRRAQLMSAIENATPDELESTPWPSPSSPSPLEM